LREGGQGPPDLFSETLMVIFETAVKGVSAAQLQRFVRRAQTLAKISGEVDVLISDNQRLRELNRRFRRKNKPTDVLSFPRPTGGDIAISADIAGENAARYGHATVEELKVLVLHGMLHLAGYDHESDNGRMARAETRLRARLKLPASLIDRTTIDRTHSSSDQTSSQSPAAVATRRVQSARNPKPRRTRTSGRRSQQ
jgi:probable rRNA maturation factor